MVSGEVVLRLWVPIAGPVGGDLLPLLPLVNGGAMASVPYGLRIPELALAGSWGKGRGMWVRRDLDQQVCC